MTVHHPVKATAWPQISHEIWEMKYRLRDPSGAVLDHTFDDTVRRVAMAVASAEKVAQRGRWIAKFSDAIKDRQFVPGGRILAGAGTTRRVTLFNCFVMGRV